MLLNFRRIKAYIRYVFYLLLLKVEYCPGDLWIITKNGSALVVWDEPHFTDNVGITKIQEKNGHRPGQTLLWGIYQIAYVASDAAGNTATCTFKVSVLCK